MLSDTWYMVPSTSWYFARLPEVLGTWYMVPSTNMWNLSQVRQGL